MDEVIERLARDLPEGYVVRISVEESGIGISLVLPDGTVIDEVDSLNLCESPEEEAIEALRRAIRMARNGGFEWADE